MPGDPVPIQPGQKVTIGTFVTDEKGNHTGEFQVNEPGRYFMSVEKDGKRQTEPVVFTCLPKCQSKGDIREGNKLIRASIRAATKEDEIKYQLSQSRSYVDSAPENLRKVARREYEETGKVAHKRSEELRLAQKRIGISVDREKGVSLDYDIKKNSAGS